MTNTKDSLVEEIETAKNGFDENVTAKITEFNNNATEQTNTFNSNAETKTADFNANASTKQTEYDDNATSKLEEYNNNSTTKLAEFNENAESYEKRIAELETERDEIAEQMPWNTTDISESIHIEDSAKYSRNKLLPFGNMTQETREGYNLLDTSVIATQTSNGVTINNNGDGSLTLNGTATKSFGINIEITQKTISAGSYTKYITKDTNIGTGLTASLGTTTSGAISITTLQPKIGIGTLELTEDLTYNQLRLYINSGTVFNNYVLKWMFVKGTYTENTIPPYEQYGAMPSIEFPSMPVVATGVQKIKKIGKNFIPYPYAENSKSTYGIQYTVNKDGSIAVSGTSKNPACDFYLYGSSTDTGEYLYIKKGTYSIADTNIYNILYIAREKTLGALIGVAKIKQALASQDCYFYGYFLRVEKDVTVNATFYPQLELNDTETFYEPYNGEKITLDLGTTELCKITDTNGNVVAQDRAVYRETDEIWKWQWEKKVLKAVINSKTEIKYNGLKNNNTAVDFLSQTLKNLPANVFSPIIEKITRYNYLKPNSTSSVNFRITVSLANLEIEKFTTPENAVKALKNLITKKGDAIIYYKATEPIYEDCTVDQSEALEKLYKMQLEKGVNNIFVESENGVTTELQLEYMQDNNLKKEQKNKALEDRITAIENLLSTTETSALLLDNMQNDLESEVK